MTTPEAAPLRHWGAILRELRTREGLSQRALAEKLGVDPSRIPRIERAASLHIHTIETYCAALGYILPDPAREEPPCPTDDDERSRSKASPTDAT